MNLQLMYTLSLVMTCEAQSINHCHGGSVTGTVVAIVAIAMAVTLVCIILLLCVCKCMMRGPRAQGITVSNFQRTYDTFDSSGQYQPTQYHQFFANKLEVDDQRHPNLLATNDNYNYNESQTVSPCVSELVSSPEGTLHHPEGEAPPTYEEAIKMRTGTIS